MYKFEKIILNDFFEFWKLFLDEFVKVKVVFDLQLVDYFVDGVKVYCFIYKSFGNVCIIGWYVVFDKEGLYLVIVKYYGYNVSYDGEIYEMVNWVFYGYVVFGMLVCGQQSSEDMSIFLYGYVLGWMMKGIFDKDIYYYWGVYLDVVCVFEVISSFDEVDEIRIGVIGGS